MGVLKRWLKLVTNRGPRQEIAAILEERAANPPSWVVTRCEEWVAVQTNLIHVVTLILELREHLGFPPPSRSDDPEAYKGEHMSVHVVLCAAAFKLGNRTAERLAVPYSLPNGQQLVLSIPNPGHPEYDTWPKAVVFPIREAHPCERS